MRAFALFLASTSADNQSDECITQSVGGYTCQRWTSQWPHRHNFKSVGHHNCCANPDDFALGDWCYTTNPDKRWDACIDPSEYELSDEEKETEFVSTTVSGKTCQAWNVQEPHSHPYDMIGDHNYCRNPSNYEGGTWCYTTDPDKRWEVCTNKEYALSEEEKKTEFVSTTVSGLTCQAWTSKSPHSHEYEYVGDHNYCRNPSDHDEGAWCYTTDARTRWELCAPGKTLILTK